MKKLVYLSLLFINTQAFANAVQTLKSYIRFDEYVGINRMQEKCTVDFIGRVGGDVLVQIFTPRRHDFLVTPHMSFTQATWGFAAHGARESSGRGVVVRSLLVLKNEIKIQREFCVEGRCWTSDVNCFTQPD
jgi:hypothetical protein